MLLVPEIEEIKRQLEELEFMADLDEAIIWDSYKHVFVNEY